jgi:hypothetical protein
MKLQSLKYNPDDVDWKTTEYFPNNSRYILVYSPEFGTSIGYKYNDIYEVHWVDALRPDEDVNITHWKELPRYAN